MLWSRLVANRRGPVPIELPPKLLARKHVLSEPPQLHVSGPPDAVAHWDEGFAAVYANLFLNLKTPSILSPVRHAQPAPAFQGIYLWDSAFIAQVWRPWAPDVARDVNWAVIEARDGDRLQHAVTDLLKSPFTQPPILAWSIWRTHAADPDPEYLERAFEPLAAYDAWLHRHRRLHDGPLAGLFFWEHPYESGVENSPRFSNRDESRLTDTRPLAAPDLCAYVVLQGEALSEMAAALGRPAEARAFRARADALRERVEARLWHEEDGLYYDRHAVTGAFVRVPTIASLLPMWAGIPDESRAARLRLHALDPSAFNTPIPFPTVARRHPAFEKDMWRGPVWINTAYAALQGLARYGFHREASELAWRLCDGVYQTFAGSRRFYEFYDPERRDVSELRRKVGNRWKLVTLGDRPRAEFVGWTGLVNTLMIEYVVGFERVDGRRTLTPRLPDQAEHLALSLRLPAEGLSIDLQGIGDRATRGAIRSARGVARFELAFGEPFDIDGRRPPDR